MTPPSLLLAGHAIMMCAFAIAAAPAMTWAQRPGVVVRRQRAMTLYLWHIPPLLAMHRSSTTSVTALRRVAGAATLASVGWGLKDLGLYCVAVMLAALAGARFLATDPHPAAAQRVCAASLPASTR